MQFEPSTSSPHPDRQVVDLRDRPFPPIGLIVDGAVADAMQLSFATEGTSDIEVAHTYSADGVGVVAVKRADPYAHADRADTRTVEALMVHGVRQVISLSHRMLLMPKEQTEPSTNSEDGLTVGVLSYGACTRLLTATFDRTENEDFVDGLFLREPNDDTSTTLLHEAKVARITGFCICLVEATTLRSDPKSRESESKLARLMLSIPDSVSPLSSCYCQNINATPQHTR